MEKRKVIVNKYTLLRAQEFCCACQQLVDLAPGFSIQSRAFFPSQISRKAELRSRLAELQLQLSGPRQTPGMVGDERTEKMKRHV